MIVPYAVLPSVGMIALSARHAEGRGNISAGEKVTAIEFYILF